MYLKACFICHLQVHFNASLCCNRTEQKWKYPQSLIRSKYTDKASWYEAILLSMERWKEGFCWIYSVESISWVILAMVLEEHHMVGSFQGIVNVLLTARYTRIKFYVSSLAFNIGSYWDGRKYLMEEKISLKVVHAVLWGTRASIQSQKTELKLILLKKIIATKSLFFPGFKVVSEGLRSALKTVQRYTYHLKQFICSKPQLNKT